MRFLHATISGALVSLSAVATLVWGVWSVSAALHRDADLISRAGPAERAVAAPTIVLERIDATPLIETFGRIQSGRRVTLASPVAGRVVEVSAAVRTGAAIEAGAVLMRLDPADQQSALKAAEAALAEAEAEMMEMRQAIRAASAELGTAQTRLDLRRRILDRQQELAERGIAAGIALDEAALALLSAEQAVTVQRQALTAARLGTERAARTVERARLAVADAERRLADTVIRAPFDGVVAAFDLSPGALVAANTPFGQFIDPTALEVHFHVTDEEYARLVRDGSALSARPVTVRPEAGLSELADADMVGNAALQATLVGAAATVPEGRTGRLLIARLPTTVARLRSGDFVGVAVAESELRNVARIPVGAATEDGRILIVGEGDRLETVAARILRREPAHLIVDRVPFGQRVVVVRRPVLGPGVLVEPYDAGPVGALHSAMQEIARPPGLPLPGSG